MLTLRHVLCRKQALQSKARPTQASPNQNVASRSHRAETYRALPCQRKRPIRAGQFAEYACLTHPSRFPTARDRRWLPAAGLPAREIRLRQGLAGEPARGPGRLEVEAAG